jgi:hypothetical protein
MVILAYVIPLIVLATIGGYTVGRVHHDVAAYHRGRLDVLVSLRDAISRGETPIEWANREHARAIARRRQSRR